MNDTILTGIEAIQAILAPALGISATALLLLSMHNRYTSTINRIRLLNEERRRHHIKISRNEEPGVNEQFRYSSISSQIAMLTQRCKEIRNAILYTMGSILLFVLTSILIGVNIFFTSYILRMAPLLIFLVGMTLVLIGIIYSAKDVINSYKVTKVEVEGDL
ncbi:MAG TPA: DUF2721 domain-containing protein [Ignavibacteria bacterium]|nr:DUF2721 domain-containing protein [Ignavibacteria bacterium]HMQ99914.1 DUF2721 domain-containing protein [Ignavibacteria bacterium]